VSVTVKPGVRFDVVAPAGFVILQAIKSTSDETGIDLVITSGTDSAHSGPDDPHKTGEAYDVRTKGMTRDEKSYVLITLMSFLDPSDFYGFIEDPAGDNEHIHVQRKKGTTFSVEEFLAYA
jgi:hypothetical protein